MALNLLFRWPFRRKPRQKLSQWPARPASRGWSTWLLAFQHPEDVRFTADEVALLRHNEELRDRPPAAAAGAVRHCRICKCTDERACYGGCSWVAADLCSACVVTP